MVRSLQKVIFDVIITYMIYIKNNFPFKIFLIYELSHY
jgi:hypothetical protein